MYYALNYPPGHETSLRIEANTRSRLGDPYSHCTDQKYAVFQKAPLQEYIYSPQLCWKACHQSEFATECGCLDVREQVMPSVLQKYDFCGKWRSNMSETIERVGCREHFTPQRPCDCHLACSERLYKYDSGSSPWPAESYQLHFYDKYIAGKTYEQHFAVYKNLSLKARKARIYKNYTEEFMREIHEQLKATDIMARNFAQLNVYFDKLMVTMLDYEESISVATLLSNVGGSLNLWIGITFCTIIELIDLLYRILCHNHGNKEISSQGQGQSQGQSQCYDNNSFGQFGRLENIRRQNSTRGDNKQWNSLPSQDNRFPRESHTARNRYPTGQHSAHIRYPGGLHTADITFPNGDYTSDSRLPSDQYTADGIRHRYSEVFREPVPYGLYSRIYTTEFIMNPHQSNEYVYNGKL